MKKHYCPVCGNEIIFEYETPSKAFRIEDETLIRDDNNLSDIPEFIPYCSYDKEHNVEPKNDLEFWKWVDDIEMYFNENNLHLLGVI